MWPFSKPKPKPAESPYYYNSPPGSNASAAPRPLQELPQHADSLWVYREYGINHRNWVPATTQDYQLWEALWTEWRARLDQVISQEMKNWLTPLGDTQESPLSKHWSPRHELYVRCLSEEVRRLELYLTKDLR